MNQTSDIARGERARAILDDPLVAEAFSVLERECIDEWRRAPARDMEGRERLWTMLRLVEKLRAHFTSLIEAGRLADSRIADLDKERRFALFR
jgi:hypothetical protein